MRLFSFLKVACTHTAKRLCRSATGVALPLGSKTTFSSFCVICIDSDNKARIERTEGRDKYQGECQGQCTRGDAVTSRITDDVF
jgi:hypothetical protein